MQLLVDAVANITAVHSTRTQLHRLGCSVGDEFFQVPTEEQLYRLEDILRLLLRVEALHAVSWLWPVDTRSMVGTAEDARRKDATSTPLGKMLPLLRRRAQRPRVLLGALWR